MGVEVFFLILPFIIYNPHKIVLKIFHFCFSGPRHPTFLSHRGPLVRLGPYRGVPSHVRPRRVPLGAGWVGGGPVTPRPRGERSATGMSQTEGLLSTWYKGRSCLPLLPPRVRRGGMGSSEVLCPSRSASPFSTKYVRFLKILYFVSPKQRLAENKGQ